MIKFLRYSSRHRLWFPRGYKGWVMPILNPMESCNFGKNKKPTWSFSEPQWFWRFRRKFFGYAGSAMCGGYKYPSIWYRGPDGFRTCSACGSLHFEDFMEICHRANVDHRYRVEGSTKCYKVYVKQPGVRNASEGAIKFYTDHLPQGRKLTDEEQEIYAHAIRISTKHFEEDMVQHRERMKAQYGDRNTIQGATSGNTSSS